MTGPVPRVRAWPQIPGVTRGLGRDRPPTEPTGYEGLNRALNGGWPISAVSQIIASSSGLGISLLTPALARMTAAGRHVALVAPPFVPYAPALRDEGVVLTRLAWIDPKDRIDALWSTEQLLRSGLFGGVALWIPALAAPIVRRLQVAADTGKAIAFLMHDEAAEADSTPAVRLDVQPSHEGLRITVERCRGARGGDTVVAPFRFAA